MSDTKVKTQDHEAPKRAKKKYRLSWATLNTMDISQAAKDEMVNQGVAEPSPDVRRLEALPEDERPKVASLLAQLNTFNEQSPNTKLGLTIRTK